MKIKRTNMQEIQETNVGVYLWMLPNGNYLADTDGNMLNAPSVQGDIQQMAAMSAAARSYGYPDGKPVWVASNRCSAEEYEEQVNDLNEGRRPDAARIRNRIL